MSLKEQVFKHCEAVIAAKMDGLRALQQDLSVSAANETKSSAGDKYETSRAMLHIEQDNIRRQQAELSAQAAALVRPDPARPHSRIGPGSLVETSIGWFYLSTALGKLTVGDLRVIALSPQSPLGARMLGLVPGDELGMNGQAIRVEAVI